MNFPSRDSLSSPLFRSNHILKLAEKMLIENILFINKSFNNLLPPIFKSWFTFCSDVHNYRTFSTTADKKFKPSYRSDSYGKNLITLGPINSWNETQLSSVISHLKHSSQPKLKVYFLKNVLKMLMKKLKGVILIKQTNLL